MFGMDVAYASYLFLCKGNCLWARGMQGSSVVGQHFNTGNHQFQHFNISIECWFLGAHQSEWQVSSIHWTCPCCSCPPLGLLRVYIRKDVTECPFQSWKHFINGMCVCNDLFVLTCVSRNIHNFVSWCKLHASEWLNECGKHCNVLLKQACTSPDVMCSIWLKVHSPFSETSECRELQLTWVQRKNLKFLKLILQVTIWARSTWKN